MPWLFTAVAAANTSSTVVPATKREDIRLPKSGVFHEVAQRRTPGKRN